MEPILNDYVFLPRELGRRLRNGQLSATEFLVMCYVRTLGNPYGIATTSIDALAADLNKQKNTINQHLLKLKEFGYLHYEPRPGKRGTFEIELGYWRLKNGADRELQPYLKRNTSHQKDESGLDWAMNFQSFDNADRDKLL